MPAPTPHQPHTCAEREWLISRVTTLEDLLGRVTEQLVARLGTNSSEWATVLEVRRTLNP